MDQNEEVAIKVENVSKTFRLPHEKTGSVKSILTNAHSFIRKQRTYETQHALQNVSFEIKKGEFFGIVGRNGSGKSTMLKMLANIYQPTSGSLHTSGKLVPFIELGVGFNPELTGRENVYLNGALLGFSENQIDAIYDEIVEFSELENFMDQKLKNYSSGMQVRLAFSVATHAEADILLVDEVLAVGDADFQKKCFKYFKDLKRQKKTVIFVSHNMQAVEEYCDRAVLIEKSKIVVRGSSREVATAYTRMFLEQKNEDNKRGSKKDRWGDNAITYESVSVAPKKLGDSERITISTVANVNMDVKEGVFGFNMRSTDDTRLVGTNNKLKQKRLVDLKKGDRVHVTWEVPNIFNTGNYIIDTAIQNADYDEVYDWWEGAAQLLVERSEENSYLVHPLIEVSVKKDS